MQREVDRYLEGLDFDEYPEDNRWSAVGAVIVFASGFAVVRLLAWAVGRLF